MRVGVINAFTRPHSFSPDFVRRAGVNFTHCIIQWYNLDLVVTHHLDKWYIKVIRQNEGFTHPQGWGQLRDVKSDCQLKSMYFFKYHIYNR